MPLFGFVIVAQFAPIKCIPLCLGPCFIFDDVYFETSMVVPEPMLSLLSLACLACSVSLASAVVGRQQAVDQSYDNGTGYLKEGTSRAAVQPSGHQ
jgi:hypothetical protein